MATYFDKYERAGAIHWREANRTAVRYNAPLVSRYRAVLDRVPPNSRQVLDIGCGDGYLSAQLARRRPKAQVYALDADRRGIELAREMAARRRILNVRFVHSTSDTLAFPDGMFDAVVMTDVIEHLDAPADLLGEIGRVLTPAGTAIVTTPHRQEGSTWDPRHVREYAAAELRDALLAHFAEVEVVGSWPMAAVRSWRAKRVGRAVLDLAARLGFNAFDRAVVDPSAAFGQLTAIARRPRHG